MGFNELLLVLMALFSIALVCAAWKLDKGRLYGVIVIFLILISISGGKIVEFFGFETNTGNIFYAAIFLATYFLIERYSKQEGYRSVWVGFVGIIFFSVLLQLVVALEGSTVTSNLNAALALAFAPASRLALASLCGYILAQTLNVYTYIRLKEHWGDRYLWACATISNTLSQALDSIVFFGVAFWGVVPPENIGEIILMGFVIKIVFVMLAAPLLYLNKVEEEKDEEYSVLILR
jgi:queuosine precursor transporter